eukprot:g16309.t1
MVLTASQLKRQRKERVFQLNKEISRLAKFKSADSEKRLTDIRAAFAAESLQFSAHTVASLVNCYVRVGNVAEAQRVYEAFAEVDVSVSGSGGRRNLVAATALLKGVFVEGADAAAAIRIIDSVVPGASSGLPEEREQVSRFWTTFYRGCLRWGHVDLAIKRWQDGLGPKDDALKGRLPEAALVYLVKLCCQGLRMTTCKEVLEHHGLTRATLLSGCGGGEAVVGKENEMEVECGGILGRIQMLAAMARARLLLMQQEKFTTTLNQAQKGLKRFFAERRSGGSFRGGKSKTPKKKGTEQNPEKGEKANGNSTKIKSSSLDTFQLHQAKDLDAELKKLASRAPAFLESAEATERTVPYDKFWYLVDGPSPIGQQLKNATVDDPRARIGCRADALPSRGAFGREFGTATSSRRKVVLEIGAGNGEWCLAQAQRDTKRSTPATEPTLYVASELRFERCARIWSDAALLQLPNLYTLGGDSGRVLRTTSSSPSPAGEQELEDRHCFFADSSVDLIVSNFPEPPQWHFNLKGQKTSSDHSPSQQDFQQHLLTAEFINEKVHRVLRKGERQGVFLVYSDNLEYLRWIAENALDAKKWCDFDDEGRDGETERPTKKRKVEGSSGRGGDGVFQVRAGQPEEYGEGEKTYFDRLWSQGNKKQRGYIKVVPK